MMCQLTIIILVQYFSDRAACPFALSTDHRVIPDLTYSHLWYHLAYHAQYVLITCPAYAYFQTTQNKVTLLAGESPNALLVYLCRLHAL